MAWRLAQSLAVLRRELNDLAPDRDKSWDGTIGDSAHRARKSDHNPNEYGVVCAFDATHDPTHNADMNILSRRIVASGHPALKYVIWNRRIWSKSHPNWIPYHGSNPHDHHCHISVGGEYDNTQPWHLDKAVPNPSQDREEAVLYRLTNPYMRGEMVKKIQAALGIEADGVFGPVTDRAVRRFQSYHALKVDGIVGPQTKMVMGV
jgi:peptidoglycan hydrolase-like protein with peptidoglycan-binding domain